MIFEQSNSNNILPIQKNSKKSKKNINFVLQGDFNMEAILNGLDRSFTT